MLHQVEQGQLVWENTAARDAFRAKTLQRVEKGASMGKSLKTNQFNGGGGGADHALRPISNEQMCLHITSSNQRPVLGAHVCHLCKGYGTKESTS